MTEDQIERAVERKVDRLDDRYLAKGADGRFAMTEAIYLATLEEIHQWAEREYSWCAAQRRAGTHGRDEQ
jgi:hypothetical protein